MQLKCNEKTLKSLNYFGIAKKTTKKIQMKDGVLNFLF